MILRMIEDFFKLFTDLSLPAVPPRSENWPEPDGRMFAWQRNRSGRAPVSPVVVYDRAHGGCAKHEFVGNVHLIKPHEYHLTLEELAAIYPEPKP